MEDIKRLRGWPVSQLGLTNVPRTLGLLYGLRLQYLSSVISLCTVFMEQVSPAHDFGYSDEVGAASYILALMHHQPQPQSLSRDEACVECQHDELEESSVNGNLAQKIILTFGITALTFVALLTAVGPDSQMAGLSFIKVNASNISYLTAFARHFQFGANVCAGGYGIIGATLDMFPGQSLTGILQSLLLPALIALALFLLLTHVLIPAYRRHRQRYAQYLPVSDSWQSSLASSTSTLRQRMSDALMTLVLPSRWGEWRFRRYASQRSRVVDAEGERGDEEMGDIPEDVEDDDMVPGRRDAVSLDQRSSGIDSNRRLSRELEEGFRDSSEEEDGPGR